MQEPEATQRNWMDESQDVVAAGDTHTQSPNSQGGLIMTAPDLDRNPLPNTRGTEMDLVSGMIKYCLFIVGFLD